MAAACRTSLGGVRLHRRRPAGDQPGDAALAGRPAPLRKGQAAVPLEHRLPPERPRSYSSHPIHLNPTLGAPQVAGQVLLNVGLGGRRRPRAQQRVHAHHEAGRAEAALRAVRARQALLHRVQPVARVADACARRAKKRKGEDKGSGLARRSCTECSPSRVLPMPAHARAKRVRGRARAQAKGLGSIPDACPAPVTAARPHTPPTRALRSAPPSPRRPVRDALLYSTPASRRE